MYIDGTCLFDLSFLKLAATLIGNKELENIVLQGYCGSKSPQNVENHRAWLQSQVPFFQWPTFLHNAGEFNPLIYFIASCLPKGRVFSVHPTLHVYEQGLADMSSEALKNRAFWVGFAF